MTEDAPTPTLEPVKSPDTPVDETPETDAPTPDQTQSLAANTPPVVLGDTGPDPIAHGDSDRRSHGRATPTADHAPGHDGDAQHATDAETATDVVNLPTTGTGRPKRHSPDPRPLVLLALGLIGVGYTLRGRLFGQER
ncbi:MAG TPA: hypothetical protein VH482_13060 [Thermomicrobiales bacterium]